MRVLLTGGGTGGHLYPGLAIAAEFQRRVPCRILFVGTKYGLEATVVPGKGYDFYTVWISGFRRGEILKNVLFPVKAVLSLVQALWVVVRFQPDVVIGTGGYVSWPVLMAAVLLRKKTVVQEQNAIPGVVTRVLAPFVDSVHLSFESSKVFFPNRVQVRVSGNPTREDLGTFSRKDGCRRFGLRTDLKTVFIFGGSQGALGINEAVLVLLDRLMRRSDVQMLWATGPRWFDEIQKKTRAYEERVRVQSYIQEMGMAYSVSDLVICRAGATTVAEVARVGVPAVYIPFPGAAGGHQEENARTMRQAGAAELVLEEEMFQGKLAEVVFALLDDSQRRREMAKRVKRFGKPEAARMIVDDVLDRIGRTVENTVATADEVR